VPSIAQVTAETHVGVSADRAAWAYAQAAACPPRAWLRRLLLVRKARVLEREMDAWAAVLYQEIRAAEHRYINEDPAA
jgi:hypothetical protein